MTHTDDPKWRRIGMDDLCLLPPTPTATPSTTNSSPTGGARPRGATTTSPDCGCDGSGYYLLAVPFGHPQFGRLQRCICGVAADTSRQDAGARRRLQDELGALIACTFESFDTHRP